MALKWGGTTVTVVKWDNTTCSAVYWGSTKVFPDYIVNFSNIFTGNTANTGYRNGMYAKNSSPYTGTTYRNTTKGETINIASVSGNALWVKADDYSNESGTKSNKLHGAALKVTSSTINLNGKSSITVTMTVTGYSNSGQGFGRFYLYYSTTAPSISSNKISGLGSGVSGASNKQIAGSNGTFTFTGDVSSLTSSYYLSIGVLAAINQDMKGVYQYTATISNINIS